MKETSVDTETSEAVESMERRVVVIVGAHLGLVGSCRPLFEQDMFAEEFNARKHDNQAYYRQATEDWRGTQRRHQSRGRRR